MQIGMSVVNLYSLPEGWQDDSQYVYIGRAGKGLDGKWGNPFKLNKEEDRAQILIKYTNYLINRIQDEKDFPWEVSRLAHKTLVCFCAPKPCHGDILHAFAVVLNMYE